MTETANTHRRNGAADRKKALRQAAKLARAVAAARAPDAARKAAAFAPRLPAATLVGLYMPIRDEIDPLPLALATGAALALPATDGPLMRFIAWAPGDRLTKSAFGVMEPAGEVVVPDLLIVPLLAFDRSCNRLGYGAGHYDRYFERHPLTARFGLAYAAQRHDEIVVEPHDVRLHGVITEEEMVLGA